MASFNKVLLMGNLTRDPQLKYLPSQTPIVEFGIACSRKFRTADGTDKEETTFVDVTSFGKQAEVIDQYFQKGKPIFIEGRLKYDTWDDKQSGAKRSKLAVVVENFQFIGGNEGGGGNGSAHQRGGGREPRRSGARGGNDASGDDDGGPPPAPTMRETIKSRRGPPAPPPFGDEQHFADADIPF